MKKAQVVTPLATDWKSAFQGQVMRSSFCLALTQPMLEFLCAVADGVRWDRALYYRSYGVARPDSWLSTGRSLEKRGLIEAGNMQGERDASFADFDAGLITKWTLTPAGAALVELLKVAGIFVEADAAIVKKLNRNKP